MRFQVPQFIEVEDKIFGPLTIKQFVYLVGSGGLAFVAVKLLPTFIGVILGLPLIAFGIALAFYKPNERQPFVLFVEYAFRYFFSEKLYIWRKQDKKPVAQATGGGADGERSDLDALYVPRLADSKLKDMTWNLDIATKELTNPVTHRDKQV